MTDDVGLHQWDIGAVIEITVMGRDGVAEDISTASVKQIKFTKPAGSSVTKDAEFTNGGSDGKVRHTTVENDLDEHGIWACRVYLTLAGGWSGHSSKEVFDVFRV